MHILGWGVLGWHLGVVVGPAHSSLVEGADWKGLVTPKRNWPCSEVLKLFVLNINLINASSRCYYGGK